ncbi:MAG TPA: hypothetical protein VGC92_09395 [Phenylobacterium sp.]
MIVFVDFEASSLADDSYPIEVGWVFEDGATEAHLIRPAPGWDDWDADAQAIHGLSRATLMAEGEPHEGVAHAMLAALGGHRAFASAPSWDGKWLSVLLRAAGLPRHALRLADSDAAHLEAAREALRDVTPAEALEDAAAAILAEARRLTAAPARHRALADAEQERRLWLEVRRLAGQARR